MAAAENETSAPAEEGPPFPIPRLKCIPNPRTPILTECLPDTTYDLDHIQPTATTPDTSPDTPALSTASKTIVQALQAEKSSPMMIEHIIRKFLIHCHFQFLDLTADPVLSRIAQFHNELVFTSAVLHHHQLPVTLTNYADMLLAEAYDLFNSTFEQKVNEEYWAAERSVDVVIAELLTKEVEKLRLLCEDTLEALSRCLVNRTLEKAPAGAAQKITAWAKDNDIVLGPDAVAAAGDDRSKR